MEDLKCKHTQKLSPTRTLNQCDQMLKFKMAQFFQKLPKMLPNQFLYQKGRFSK